MQVLDEFAEHKKIAQDEFCFMPSRLKLINDPKEGAPVAYIDRMQVVINEVYIERALSVSPMFGLAYFRDIERHEHRHLFADGAPITVRNTINFQKMLKDIFRDVDFIAVPVIANIIYDVIVDVANLDLLGSRIDIPARVVYKDFKDIDVSNVGTAYLIAFREDAMGENFSGLEIGEQVRKAAQESVAICRRREELPLEDQVRQIGEILHELFITNPPPESQGGGGKSLKERLQDLADALSEAMKKENKDPIKAPTIEDMTTDPDQAKMDEVDFDDRDEVIIIGKLLDIKGKEMNFWELRMKARRNLNFRVRSTGKFVMNSFKAGFERWSQADMVKRMDIQATMRARGINIPTVTTQKKFMVSGPGAPLEGSFPPLYAALDSSGSMRTPNDDAILALFCMIEAAKRHGVQCGFTLFADETLDWPLTYDYESLFRAAFEHFDDAGGGNDCSGIAHLVGRIKPGTLLVYVTDFGLEHRHKQQSLTARQTFLSQGVQFIFVNMFTKNHLRGFDVPTVFCKRVEDLSEVMLAAVDN